MKRFIPMILSLSIVQVHAGEEAPVELAEVPEPVMQAIQERFEAIELTSANTETEIDGYMVYEVQGNIPAGEFLDGEHEPLVDEDGDVVFEQATPAETSRQVEFDLTPDGKFDEIEIEFLQDMVPGAVLQAVKRAHPEFEARFIEASYSSTMDVIGYEFSGQNQDQPMDLEVSPSGRHIQLADD